MGQSSYSAQLMRAGRVIAVVDLAESNEHACTVTNNAETVVRALGEIYGLKGRRIIYQDTEGVWDELEHDGLHFTNFAPLRERNLWRALESLDSTAAAVTA